MSADPTGGPDGREVAAPDWRPRAHFAPRRHWINDPNGLVHHAGTWHLFFQHNPEGPDWGNMSWGHATSTDLVHWTEHPVALSHDLDTGEQVYSGSVVVDHANTSGLGREGDAFPPFVAIWTSARDGHQAQSLACSRDGGSTWVRCEPSPVLDRGSADFRDPKVSWCEPDDGGDGFWLLVAVEAVQRLVVFYRSSDLWDWELLSELGPLPAPSGIWECPDLVPLPVEGEPGEVVHVLVLSGNDGTAPGCGTWYAAGRFDGVRFTPEPAGFRRLDHGPDDYAAVTWNGAPDGRRVLIGWMANWAYARDLPTGSWRGAMTLPRELSVRRRDGGVVLVQRPVEEARSAPGLRWRAVELDVRAEASGVVQLQGGGAGDGARLVYDRDTGLLSLLRGPRAGGAEPFHPAYPCRSSCPVPVGDGVVRVEVAVDACSVEVFAERGEVVFTALVFPGAMAH
ncbi:glycoside hydrolase family 32 protein [Phycicoccus ginsengisoli]